MKKNTMIVFIIALLVIGGVAFALVNNSKDDNALNTAGTNSQDAADAEDSNDVAEEQGAGLTDTTDEASVTVAATITYGNGGFSPSSVTVKAGDTIKVVNSSSQSLDFASDPHPVHTDDPELNAGDIAPGASKTFTVKNAGTWGFHNHDNEDHEGTLIVQ